MKIQKVLVIVCALFLLITLGTALRAAETPGGQLPSAARVAFDEGMVAVGQQQWTVAIRNFLKAQKAAPEAPEVLFNLGLAESKVPGRELRAIAWFQAYLFAVPAAANAGAVRKEMVNLKVRVEGTLDKLINQAGRLAALESYPYSHYADIAVAQARAGDIAVAKRMAAKALNDKNSTFHVNDALSKISVIQYNAGDVAGAEDTIREIGPGGTRERPYGFQSSAYGFIAFLQAMDGAFSRAEATIERARSDGSKCPAYLFVAAKEALAGKKDQASSMITKALAIPMEDSSTYLGEIMTIQEYLGDSEGAKKTSMKYIGELRRNSFLSKEEIEDADRRNREEIAKAERNNSALRDRIEFEANSMTRALLGFISRPDILRLKLEISGNQDKRQELIGLLNKQLDKEIFIDQESALRTIASGKTPEEIFSRMMKAIEATTDLLDYMKILGR